MPFVVCLLVAVCISIAHAGAMGMHDQDDNIDNSVLPALINRYESLLHSERSSAAVSPSSSSRSSSTGKRAAIATLKTILAFNAITGGSPFVQPNPMGHRAPSHSLQQPRLPKHPSTGRLLIQGVSNNMMSDPDDHEEWVRSKQQAINNLPNHDKIPKKKLLEWSKMADERVYAQMDKAFYDTIMRIWQGILKAEEQPLMNYLAAYWKQCGILSVSSDECALVSKHIEPMAAARIRDLKQLVEAVGLEQAQVVSYNKNSLPLMEIQLSAMIASANPRMSDKQVQASVDEMTKRMSHKFEAIRDKHLKKVIGKVNDLFIELTQRLAEAVVKARAEGMDEAEIKKLLKEWAEKVHHSVEDYLQNKEWLKEYDEALDPEPLIKEFQRRQREENSEWQARMIDENVMYARWLRKHNGWDRVAQSV